MVSTCGVYGFCPVVPLPEFLVVLYCLIHTHDITSSFYCSPVFHLCQANVSPRGKTAVSPLFLLLSRVFTYELRVSPGGIHATIPLFHWFCSCFLVAHVFYQCDIRILVVSHEIRKLFLLDFCRIPCGYSGVISCGLLVGFCRDSCVILAKIMCMLADCCGVIPPASAHKKSRLESQK